MPASTSALRILVYSDNAQTREQVMRALGKRLHPGPARADLRRGGDRPDGDPARWMQGGIDLAILDGEATPTGGMGIAKQLKDELATAHRSWCSPGGPTMRGWPTGRAPRPRCRTPSTPSCWAARCLGCCAPRSLVAHLPGNRRSVGDPPRRVDIAPASSRGHLSGEAPAELQTASTPQ